MSHRWTFPRRRIGGSLLGDSSLVIGKARRLGVGRRPTDPHWLWQLPNDALVSPHGFAYLANGLWLLMPRCVAQGMPPCWGEKTVPLRIHALVFPSGYASLRCGWLQARRLGVGRWIPQKPCYKMNFYSELAYKNISSKSYDLISFRGIKK